MRYDFTWEAAMAFSMEEDQRALALIGQCDMEGALILLGYAEDATRCARRVIEAENPALAGQGS